MSRTRPLSSSLAALSALALLTALGGCKEEDNRLFDESGVWSMTNYTNWATDDTSYDGTLFPAPLNTHENAFMLNFNRDLGIVAAAACGFQGSGTTPATSTCRIGDADDLDWECNCFAYEFDNDVMRWTEFAPGDQVPSVGSGDTDGASGTTTITATEFTEISNSYQLTPLPGPSTFDLDGLFESDGDLDRFVFGQRTPSLFTESGCDVSCFGE